MNAKSISTEDRASSSLPDFSLEQPGIQLMPELPQETKQRKKHVQNKSYEKN